MDFEFDIHKSAANKQKHGIDFLEAQTLWNGKVVWSGLKYPEEKRHLVFGKINDKFWTAIVTMRGQNVRIISVRKSRKKERSLYEKS